MVNDRIFFNRDISWLSFNERVLAEAARPTVPLMERFRFLAIYSSNLDEFYRVRIPTYNKKKATDEDREILGQIRNIINRHLEMYGDLIRRELIPAMEENGLIFLYDTVIPGELHDQVADYFLNQVAGYIHIESVDSKSDFFPVNNHLYKAVLTRKNDQLFAWIINIPSNHLPRFQVFSKNNRSYILLLDDIIDQSLKFIFRESQVVGGHNVKLTRDASLELIENAEEDTADLIEKELSKRDRGKATRFLYDPGMSRIMIDRLRERFDLKKSALVAGGRYHNLKDFGSIPLKDKSFEYPLQPPLINVKAGFRETLFNIIMEKDRLVHSPYHSYDCIHRFFNEAALDNNVEQIYITFYRIANDSRIGHALISAAKNGKDVYVVVELKARFDEANNIRWAKSMKAAGIKIVYSENELKVHAKVALIKRKGDLPMIGLLSTGNFNENTARIYTDHTLLTAHQPMLSELHKLFQILIHERKIKQAADMPLDFLLVAQFNLYEKFVSMIDREINNAIEGLSASIIIKLNNLEEESLILKLYEASNAGVKIQLLVRGICRLVPGMPGQSERITVHRIIDRYLEHGRIFIFENKGQLNMYMGSSDWMNRNIYHRIEVCFPILDPDLKMEMYRLIELQLQDNVQAVLIDQELNNVPVKDDEAPIRSQVEIHNYLSLRAQD
ncbi:polyphosphate kinase 1 [Flavitalea sp.]|nr:polyphosphate kinase 1 [Flavitalea sp.]